LDAGAAPAETPITSSTGSHPATLELVIFSKKSDGPSRVSDDGEVIFFLRQGLKQTAATTDAESLRDTYREG
jgi:hypothetical protein